MGSEIVLEGCFRRRNGGSKRLAAAGVDRMAYQ